MLWYPWNVQYDWMNALNLHHSGWWFLILFLFGEWNFAKCMQIFFRYIVFTMIFLLCCLRDWTNGDASVLDFLHSIYFIIVHRIIPSIKMKIDGVPITFGLIQGKIIFQNALKSLLAAGVWAGHFARDHCKMRDGTPELFLYSNNDYYLSYRYLEKKILGNNISFFYLLILHVKLRISGK